MPNYNLETDSPQWYFQQSRAKVQGFAGSFANGKSTGMIIKVLRIIRDYPGCLALMARATYPKLNSTFRRDFLRWCPPEWIKRRPTQDDNTCIMINGSEVHFRYVAQKGKLQEDGSTTSNLLSATYDLIALDQMEDPEIEYKDFLDLLGRLRGSTPYRPSDEDDLTMPRTGPRWFMFGVNPTRNWVYKKVVHPYLQYKKFGIKTKGLLLDKDTGENILDLTEADIYSNQANLEPDYIKSLETVYTGQMYDRFVKGEWAAYEGLIYGQYQQSIHTISRDQAMEHIHNCLERHVKLVVLEGYDYGLVSPSCYLLSFIDDYGRVIVLDGFHKAEFPYDEQPAAIKAIRARYAGLLRVNQAIKADPAIFRNTVLQKMSTGTSVAKLLSDMGLSLTPGQNDIVAGITKVGSYLNNKIGVPHLLTGGDKGPLLYFVNDLEWMQEEIGAYYWKKNPMGERIDEPVDGNDHALDALKYLMSKLPEPSKIVLPKNKLPPGWMVWSEMSTEDYKQRKLENAV